MSDRSRPATYGGRYIEPVRGTTDEDRDFAYVDVTAATSTADAARAWLLETPAGHEVLGFDAQEHVLLGEHIELRSQGYEWHQPVGELPDALDIERMVQQGALEAYWRFDVSMALGSHSDSDERWDARFAARTADAKRNAQEWRGPWWWRLRCRLADRVSNLGCRLEPHDRSSVGWSEDGTYVIAEVRRPDGR